MCTTRTAGPSARSDTGRAAVAAAIAAACWAEPASAANFDFYVLSLSWSPSYCIAEGDAVDPAECSKPRGFVVHGLWPQRAQGYPEFCPRAEDAPSAETLRRIAPIMPGAGLARHQWRKHGSCSGLPSDAYFGTLRRAFENVTIPDTYKQPRVDLSVSAGAVEAAFVAANPGLAFDGIAIRCKGSLLREVRICLTRDLGFRACAEVDRRGCRRGRTVTMPAPAP